MPDNQEILVKIVFKNGNKEEFYWFPRATARRLVDAFVDYDSATSRRRKLSGVYEGSTYRASQPEEKGKPCLVALWFDEILFIG